METPKKLTLEHLAPYLPYGLNVKIIPISNLYEEQVTIVECLSSEFVTFKKAPDYYFEDEEPDIDFKPILRSLSEWMDCIIFTEKENLWISNAVSHGSYSQVSNLPTWKFNALLYDHFDVFGLIPAGLAIDINTIDNSK